MNTSDFKSRHLHINSVTNNQPKSVPWWKRSLKIPVRYLPSQVERYWTINLWSDKQWQCPYYLHMTLRSPKNTDIGCDTAPNNVSLVQAKEKKKKKVKMNRVFGSPYKFSLYSHYTHFSQQYSISLSMSCTLCVLTQILRELKAGQYHPSKWDSRWNSSTHPTTAKFHSFCFSCEFVIYKSHTPYSDTVAPDSTESITMSPLAKICCIPSQ